MAITTATVRNIHVGPGTLVLTRSDNGSTTTVTFSATEDGGVLRISRSIDYVDAAEVLGPVKGYITGEEVTFELNSIEYAGDIIREALGHSIVTSTAATTGAAGKDEIAFGGHCQLRESALTYTVPRDCDSGLNIILDLYRVVATTDIEQRFTRSGKTVYRVAFRALNDMDRSAGQRIGKITMETTDPL